MKEECLICKAPLEYLETDVLMECEICHKKENSKTRCVSQLPHPFILNGWGLQRERDYFSVSPVD